MVEIDFEGTGVQGTGSTPEGTPKESKETTPSQEDVTHLNGESEEDITGKDGNSDNPDNNENNDTNPSTGELNVGDQIEVDGVTYTVAENGDIVDEKGTIFKEAKDVKSWLASVSIEDDEDSQITLSSIQDSLGVTITDEKGNTVEFDNTPEGVKSYVDAVIDLKSKDIQTATINRFYADNPLVKNFVDYVQLNGSPRGFGEIPDRSSITLDKNNEAQLIAVIKMAANEFGNKSLNDNYIKYLKDGGGLYDEAQNQLNALIEKDKAYKKDIETKAAKQIEEEADRTKKYWENVNNIINGGVISGYKIPENFTKEIDGKKIITTRNDFFDYVSKASAQSEDGRFITAYQKDLESLTDEEFTNKELLDAYLLYTGRTYKDLIDMAVKEEAVRKLKIKSKESRSTKLVKVVKQQKGKASIDDIVL